MQYISVVLADDDHLVLQDMKTLVNWQKLGFQIVAAASNGKQALKYIEQHHPMLLITDVMMPIIDGLELTEIVRQKYPDMQVLIISSYDEFEYAKKAIRHGVADYILKSEITSASFSKKLTSIYNKNQERLQINVKAFRQELSQYFDDESYYRLSPGVFPNIDQISGGKYYFMLVTQITGFTTDMSALLLEWKTSARFIIDLITQSDDEVCSPIILFTHHHFVFLGFRIESSSQNQTFTIRSIRNRLYSIINNRCPRPCAQFYYPTAITIESFKKIFIQKGALIRFYAMFYEDYSIDITALKLSTCILTDRNFAFQTLSANLEHLEDDIIKIKEYITERFNNKDLAAITKFYDSFAHYIEYNSNYQIKIDNVLYLSSLELFLKWAFNELESLISIHSSHATEHFSAAVQSAISFMEESYSTYTLTSEEIAGHVGLSAGRLGVLFKQDTGNTINEYLTKIRIKNSIYLLENTHMKIYEVSEKCGYRSSQYFSQIFYQKTGNRPIDYRKSPVKKEKNADG